MPKGFTPNFNGFTISSLKTMIGEEGLITSCNLLFKGKKLGSYFDAADGSMYRFYPEIGFSEQSINEVLKAFPTITIDCEFDDEISSTPLHWDIGLLVEELVSKKEMQKQLKKALETSRDLLVINSKKQGRSWTATIPNSMSDKEADMIVAKQLVMQKCNSYDIKRYRSLEDLNTQNTEVDILMFK